MYIYMKKSPITGQLTEIRTINSNPRDNKFLKEIAKAGKLDATFLEKVKLDVDAQLQKSRSKDRFRSDFDIDFDLKQPEEN